MCKRKHYHPRDRALLGDGARGKPSHTPEATLSEPAPPTTATGTSTMYQPKSSSGSSSIPASDPNRTSQQYIRADTSTLRTIPRAVPQGCFCAACNTQVRIPAIIEHLKPTEHTAKCKSMGLYCVPCQKPFLNDFALGVHKQTAHKLDTSRTDSPANTAKNHELLQSQAKARREIDLYCAECNMVFRTKHQLEIHIRTTRHQPGIPISVLNRPVRRPGTACRPKTCQDGRDASTTARPVRA